MKTNFYDRAVSASTGDRRTIRVELPSECAGVAAALRRAFTGAALSPANGEFDALLRRLN